MKNSFNFNIGAALFNKIIKYSEKALVFIILLALIILIPKLLKKSLRKLSKSTLFDETIIYFLESMILIVIRVCFVILCLSLFEVDLRTFFTFLGAIGISLTIALQQSISSLCAGFNLIISRTIKTGERVKIGEIQGIVKQIHLMHTIIKSEKEDIIIPNNFIVSNFVKIIKEN